MTGGAGLPTVGSSGKAAGLSSSTLGAIGFWAVFRDSACATRFSSSVLTLASRLVASAWSSCAMYLCGGPTYRQAHHLCKVLALRGIRWQQMRPKHVLLVCEPPVMGTDAYDNCQLNETS